LTEDASPFFCRQNSSGLCRLKSEKEDEEGNVFGSVAFAEYNHTVSKFCFKFLKDKLKSGESLVQFCFGETFDMYQSNPAAIELKINHPSEADEDQGPMI
jgi:hypothetical protein